MNVPEKDIENGTEESKSEKFKRLASGRTNKILSTLTLLGNCSNTGSYEYTQEEVDKIFTALQSKLDETKAKFHPKNKEKEDLFTL